MDAGSLGGEIRLLRPVPREFRQDDKMIVDPWGDLAPLRQEPEFAKLIPVVTGEAFSHAMYGWMRPLMDQLGSEPRFKLMKIVEPYNRCSARNDCVMFNKDVCQPRHPKLPECWSPDVSDHSVIGPMAVVTLAWSEGRYVIVVDGDEFVIGQK